MEEKINLMLAHYRLKWVNLVIEKGLSRKGAARLSDHSPNTIPLWIKRYQEKGIEGLKDKSRAPLTHPNEYSKEIIEKILKIREETGFCAQKIKKRLEKEQGTNISS